MTKKSDAPAIRFKGFSDAWEQRKAKEICSIGTGKSNTQDQVDDGKYPFYIRSDVPVRSNKYLYDCEAVITIGDGNIGKVFHYVNGKFDLHQRCYKMTDFKDIWGKYFFYYFSTKFYDRAMKMTAKATVDSVRLEMISEMDIKKPPQISEQKQIAEFFANLDNLITLHQRKCANLCSPSQVVFSLLFATSTFSWEQRKLGDNIIEYTETTTKNNQYPPLTSSRKGIFLQTEYFAGNQIASDDNTGYNIVPYGYFTYRHMSDDEIFHFNINDIVENGIVSTLYPVFTTDENLDSRYLQYQLNYGYEFAKFAILQKQGGSRTYMYLNKLKQLYLTMPKSVEEQNAISAFFMSLDHLITLHQRKGKAAVSGCSNDTNNSKGVCCNAGDFGYKCHKKVESQ